MCSKAGLTLITFQFDIQAACNKAKQIANCYKKRAFLIKQSAVFFKNLNNFTRITILIVVEIKKQ